MTARQYLLRILCGTLLLSAVFFVLNLVVDPLDIYRLYKEDGFNAIKPKATSYARLAKPIQIERNQYEWLALGSSRVLLGIPTTGFAASVPEEKRFNAGLSGVTINMVDKLFRHAVSVAPVKEVVISTDFFMFNAYTQGYFDTRLADTDEGVLLRWQRQASDYVETLFSPQLTSSSVYTVRRQQKKYQKYKPDGQAINEREIEKTLPRGYVQVFEKFEDGMAGFQWTPCRDNQYRYTSSTVDTLQEFRHLLVLAADNNIRVRLFISPVHARLLEALDATGLWSPFEQWKVDITRVVAEVKQQHPASDIQLWDFSGYNRFTTEELPTAPNTPMQWYLDASHFRDTLGVLLLETLHSGDTSQYPAVQLLPETVVAHNQAIAQDQLAYRATHREQYSEIQARMTRLVDARRRHGIDCAAQ